MKIIAKLVFKIYIKIYGYPMRSHVRLVMENLPNRDYSLTYTVGLLYVCGESIDDLCDWYGFSRSFVVTLLNQFVEKYK